MMLASRSQRITFGEMREMGVRGVLVYCAEFESKLFLTGIGIPSEENF